MMERSNQKFWVSLHIADENIIMWSYLLHEGDFYCLFLYLLHFSPFSVSTFWIRKQIFPQFYCFIQPYTAQMLVSAFTCGEITSCLPSVVVTFGVMSPANHLFPCWEPSKIRRSFDYRSFTPDISQPDILLLRLAVHRINSIWNSHMFKNSTGCCKRTAILVQ